MEEILKSLVVNSRVRGLWGLLTIPSPHFSLEKSMLVRPQPSTFGQTKKFHQGLYLELQQAGYSHADLQNMSLSKALLARFGSIQAVDQFLGQGTFQGVKDQYGPWVPWRKTWIDVRNEMKATYLAQLAAEAATLKALKESQDALSDAINRCRAAGITDPEIMRKVLDLLSPAAWQPSFTTTPLVRGTVVAQHQPLMERSNQAWQ